MTTFTEQISREQALKYGMEAVQIIRNGGYATPAGRFVNLEPAIARAVSGTTAYPPEAVLLSQQPGGYETMIEVQNETTLSAARRLQAAGCSTAVLNFASATHPGGGFLDGARAQEEYLARSSGLYACLRDQPMYAFHKQRRDPLYTSYMIYSPEVPVFRGDDGLLLEEPYTLGMITAAAPNASYMSAERNGEIEQAFRERIARVLAISLRHGHEAIVLGAWGCGAFGNDGRMVSRLFRQALRAEFAGAFRQVCFAIVDWSAERRFIGPFVEAFEV